MHESPADVAALQELLDRSYGAAGSHLLRIHTPERRLGVEQVAERLTGMCLLALATVTADGRPVVGPVDGIFYRGAFHFGSSPDSVRFRHIRARPQVSAALRPRVGGLPRLRPGLRADRRRAHVRLRDAAVRRRLSGG
ncbi:MAG TPA: pyridoxamine 5'-phosphate oxidase family protein [Solirubrobacterales bacterium]|nr:pyridoxamine 5'-phosphate oxidase family protein [Solirubrobacterales bacterium]